MRTRRIYALVAIVALLILLSIAGSVRAEPPADEPSAQGLSIASVVSPLLQYQGRLTNPSTGAPVADGSYTMVFRLYDVASGGSALWTETKDVSVQNGLFSTVLGDTTALAQSLFNGQALWLGIKVGTDAEATPRQRVLPVAYALSLAPGAVISATSSSPVLQVNNTGSGPALYAAGAVTVTGNLSVGGSLAGASHTHSGTDIASGTVAEARIDPAIARDAEVTTAISAHAGNASAHHTRYTDSEAWSAVLANDGPGSGLNADLLDGYHAGNASSNIPVSNGTLNTNLNADLLDGQHASAFAGASHTHDDRYYTEAESDARFVNVTGPEGISGSSANPILVVTQTGLGASAYFTSTNSYGVRGETASASAGQAGVLGVAGWTALTPNQEVGVLGKSSAGHGVAGMSDNQIGVYGYSGSSYGVWGEASGSSAGVLGANWGTGIGVYGYSSASHGVYGAGGSGSDDYGGYFTGWGGVAGLGTSGYGGYFTSSSGPALYAAGNAQVTGYLTTTKVAYSSPRTHYFTVGGEAFVPGSNVAYVNTYGVGGAYIVSGAGALVAPVHLPDGAVVTEFRVFFNDTSASDMTVYLNRLSLQSGGYTFMASVSSSGTSGYYNLADTTISSATVDNTVYSYHIYAYSSAWDYLLMIMGARVTYSISEAP